MHPPYHAAPRPRSRCGRDTPTSLICAGAGSRVCSCPWQARGTTKPALPMTTLGHTGRFRWPFYSCSRSSPASGFDHCSHAPRGNPTGPNSLLVLPPNTLSHGQPCSSEHALMHTIPDPSFRPTPKPQSTRSLSSYTPNLAMITTANARPPSTIPTLFPILTFSGALSLPGHCRDGEGQYVAYNGRVVEMPNREPDWC